MDVDERNGDFGVVKNSTAFALRCTDVSNGLKGTLCVFFLLLFPVFFSFFLFSFLRADGMTTARKFDLFHVHVYLHGIIIFFSWRNVYRRGEAKFSPARVICRVLLCAIFACHNFKLIMLGL